MASMITPSHTLTEVQTIGVLAGLALAFILTLVSGFAYRIADRYQGYTDDVRSRKYHTAKAIGDSTVGSIVVCYACILWILIDLYTH